MKLHGPHQVHFICKSTKNKSCVFASPFADGSVSTCHHKVNNGALTVSAPCNMRHKGMAGSDHVCTDTATAFCIFCRWRQCSAYDNQTNGCFQLNKWILGKYYVSGLSPINTEAAKCETQYLHPFSCPHVRPLKSFLSKLPQLPNCRTSCHLRQKIVSTFRSIFLIKQLYWEPYSWVL